MLSGKIQAQGVVQLYLVAKDWKEQKSNQIEVLAHLHYFQVNNKIMIKTFQPEKFNLQLSETDFKAEFFKQISTSQLMLS
ncbi:hypothetical protein J8L86_20105 [Shewanella sp. MMG014]|uniref:hypothetical protein n=1 Tax=Shewanella sp. MMG014 TaxID=2822691 RepID=UPI001B37DD03|nr:hypothetical protein [Shewanella sp. MMG014]MBQ4892160.1 hypothetical protein [Shewanella sp. MMG014]